MIIYFSTFVYISTFAQGELKSIDSTLKRIDRNVLELKDKIVEGKRDAFNGQSMFEDKNGVSAIFLPDGGIFRLNTADASLKLAFINKVSNKNLFYGFDISGKANNGIISVISTGNISPGVRINGIVGLKEFFKDDDYLDGWLTLKMGYERVNFKLFSPTANFGEQISNKTFESPTGLLSFNLKLGGTALIALGAGYRKSNNFDDLDEIKLTDTKQIINQATNTIRTYSNSLIVKSGSFKSFNQGLGFIDIFWIPKNLPRIGFFHYYRPMLIDKKVKSGLGSGFYLLKKKNPFASIAGISIEIPSLEAMNNPFRKNFIVNFLIGYNFGI